MAYWIEIWWRDSSPFFQSPIVQFWWSYVNCGLRIIFLVDRSDAQCALVQLLQGLTCVLTDSSYLGLTSGYLSLPVSLKQSSQSPLTSGINKAFSVRELWLAGYFLFFRYSLLCGKIPVYQFISAAVSGTNNLTFKVTFIPYSARFKL